MPALVIAEHDGRTLHRATLHTVGAASACACGIHMLVAGHDCAGVAAEAARVAGVSRVLHADAEHLGDGVAENLAPQIVALAGRYSHILAPASAFGRNVLPRVAALLDVVQISDIIEVLAPDTFRRPIYAGSAVATVRGLDAVQVMTVRGSAFEPAAVSGASADIERVAVTADSGLTQLLERDMDGGERPELGSARVVVSGGRGLGSRENFESLLGPLAKSLGAALGASRAAVDAGYAPNEWQVGQTGRIVAPQVYVAVGISGAIQHLAGMKDSKLIVAINQDADAPIFGVADFGLVADLFDVVPALGGAFAVPA
jgi:electron transfer flavoprotein alpha subunit